MSDEKHICCICKGIFFGYGNNPEPVESKGRCCDDCNNSHVIATRLGNLGIIPTDKEITVASCLIKSISSFGFARRLRKWNNKGSTT